MLAADLLLQLRDVELAAKITYLPLATVAGEAVLESAHWLHHWQAREVASPHSCSVALVNRPPVKAALSTVRSPPLRAALPVA